MLAPVLGAISERLDFKFLTAYWLPAFVAVLGGFGILAVVEGPQQIDAWVSSLDSVEQTLAALLLLLTVSMLAFVLRALTWPITEIFAGDALPREVAEWLTRGQLRVKHRAAQWLDASTGQPDAPGMGQQTRQRLKILYPLDDAKVRPTLFGNVLATAFEYPRLIYRMEGLLWWPRLSPLVPEGFQALLGAAQAPMMAMLNLSVVFTALALGGAVIFVLAGGHPVATIVMLLGGLLLARLCYRAAASQATEAANLVRVGFDLYRHDILRQMGMEVPADLAAERTLWQALTTELLDLPPAPPSTGSTDLAEDLENGNVLNIEPLQESSRHVE